jgi:hypothetical protein
MILGQHARSGAVPAQNGRRCCPAAVPRRCRHRVS